MPTSGVIFPAERGDSANSRNRLVQVPANGRTGDVVCRTPPIFPVLTKICRPAAIVDLGARLLERRRLELRQ
jgi:hypothetical protein